MPIKVLVVEDETDLEFLMTRKFRAQIRAGELHFLFAANGVEALQQLERHPDIYVVLSDIRMPQMDGLTLLAHLNERYPLRRTIIISAYSDMANIRTAMNRGAFDFLTKPLDFKDLELTLKKTIRHVQQLLHEVNLDATDPKFTPFTAKIRQLAKEFQIEEIQEFIQHYLSGEGSS